MYVDKVAAGVDVLDAVEIGNIDVSDGAVGAMVDLYEEMSMSI